VGSTAVSLNREKLPGGEPKTRIQIDLAQRRERDGKDNGVVRLTNSLRAVFKCELNGAPGVLASPDQPHPKLDLTFESVTETLGDLIVAANDVISLVAEYAERPELGPAIRMDEEQKA